MAQVVPFEQPKNYVCQRSTDRLTIDGLLNEPIWQKAQWSDAFLDIEGDKKPQPEFNTKVKMLWDDEYLYIGAWLEEPHLCGTLKERDAIIYNDNDFEVFIDPDGDNHNYVEIEINVLNTVMDLFMVKPYRDHGPMLMGWNAKGLQHAISTNGTINYPSDTDSSWTVEMAIPISTLTLKNKKMSAKPGDIWRINFSRVQWDMQIVEDRYKKLDKDEHNWVWSPQGRINMHYPEKWGYLQFSDSVAGQATSFNLPEGEVDKWLLQQVYYAQAKHFKADSTYVNHSHHSMKPFVEAAGSNQLTIALTADGYQAILIGKGALIWVIDNTGRIWQKQ